MSGMVVCYMLGFSRKFCQTRKQTCIDLVFVFQVMDHRRIILCDGSQGFVPIDVTLANKLPVLWVNPTKISHLLCDSVRRIFTDVIGGSVPLCASMDSNSDTFRRSLGSGRYTCVTLVSNCVVPWWRDRE